MKEMTETVREYKLPEDAEAAWDAITNAPCVRIKARIDDVDGLRECMLTGFEFVGEWMGDGPVDLTVEVKRA